MSYSSFLWLQQPAQDRPEFRKHRAALAGVHHEVGVLHLRGDEPIMHRRHVPPELRAHRLGGAAALVLVAFQPPGQAHFLRTL
ncbi:MAG: hypothetical protein NT167_22255, partial [Verrucomicrobia bacterium]|nr:hypothetical protein [Verrucomicrobiota bacterium]